MSATAVRWTLPRLDPSRSAADGVGTVDAPDVLTPAVEPVETVEPVAPAEPSLETVPAADDEAGEALDDTFDEPVACADTVLGAEREAAYAAGFEAGRVDGHAAGLEAGRTEGRADLDVSIATLGSVLDYLAKPLVDHDDRLEDELVALSVAVARQLVRRELSTAPGEIVPVVREALAALPSSQRDVSVCLHPDDAALVRDVLAQSAESAAWTLSEDPLLSRGGCRVEAGYSHVDATLETRLQHIATALSARSRADD
ncbi:MAG: flagellar assembly protein FliH [Pseudomonadota bacterium]